MCGICGFLTRRDVHADVLRRMSDTLEHRGPDDRGEELFSRNGARIGLAHRRLSIMDLSERGHQPMFSNDGQAVVVFNGEIYNFRELRRELSGGYEFHSSCDTEVILAAYQKWGEGCLCRLDGMFAMAIYDFREDKLVLARDRVGKKPLYYYWDGSELAFGSELKAIMQYDSFPRDVRSDVLGSYLYHGYIQGERTIFRGASKLPAGTMLVLRGGSLEKRAYWSIEECFDRNANGEPFRGSYGEAVAETRELVEGAVLKRMEADVPVGVFFSGGIDSTLVAAIMQRHAPGRVRTYTIGFYDKDCDEAGYAGEIAGYLGCDHAERYIGESEMLNLVHNLPRYFDEPMADPAAIPTLLLSELAAPDVKVVLTGDGGDEFFCGYRQYRVVRCFRAMDWARPLLPSREFLYGRGGRAAGLLFALKNNDDPSCKTQCVASKAIKIVRSMLAGGDAGDFRFHIEGGLATDDWARRRMLVDAKTQLADEFLVKTDRATMAHSLEARCPLLDGGLVEESFRLPTGFLRRGRSTKRILRDILAEYVPRELFERPKHGFSVPIGRWLGTALLPQLERFADAGALGRQGLFDAGALGGMVRDFGAGNGRLAGFLWRFYVFQMWYQRYVEDLWAF